MRLGRNLAAGLGSSLWTALLGFAVVPLYLKYLGIEAYGLIGFFATLQALFQILDFGLAPTINREVARCTVSGRWAEAHALLRTLAVIYWAMAALIALLVYFIAPTIAESWLNLQSLPKLTVVHAVMLMGVVVACRWPIGLYQGSLVGMQKLVVTSAINAAMVTLGNLGAVAVLAFWSRTIDAFFLWQACIGFLYAIVVRWASLRALGKPPSKTRVDFSTLKPIWRFSAGMVILAISGVIFAQLDKVLLSKLLSLTEFGRYTLAAVVAGGLNVIIAPFYNALYPRFSVYVASAEPGHLLELYRTASRLLATIMFSIAMVLVVCAQDIVGMWTGNVDLAHRIAPLVALLGVGTAIHGVMYIPHAVQLAYGKVFIPLIINTLLMVIMVPLIVLLAMRYGAFGGATAWLILHLLYMALGSWMTNKYLLPGTGASWLCKEVGIPMAIAAAFAMIGKFGLSGFGWPPLCNVAVGCTLFVLSIVTSLGLAPRARRAVFDAVHENLKRRQGYA